MPEAIPPQPAQPHDISCMAMMREVCKVASRVNTKDLSSEDRINLDKVLKMCSGINLDSDPDSFQDEEGKETYATGMWSHNGN